MMIGNKHLLNVMEQDMFDLYEFVNSYTPADEAETADLESFLQFLKLWKDNDIIYTRDCLMGHLTGSAMVINKNRTKVLMAFHHQIGQWAWLGGHTDADKDILAVAQREVNEETGLEHFKTLNLFPVDLSVTAVKTHIKRGKVVSGHLHYDVCYAFEADENEAVRLKPDENSGVKWLNISDIEAECTYNAPRYLRIIEKMKKLG